MYTHNESAEEGEEEERCMLIVSLSPSIVRKSRKRRNVLGERKCIELALMEKEMPKNDKRQNETNLTEPTNIQSRPLSQPRTKTATRSIDPVCGKRRWDHKLHRRVKNLAPSATSLFICKSSRLGSDDVASNGTRLSYGRKRSREGR